MTVKRVAILGSTGSIGRSALAVVDAHPTRLKVVSLAAGDNAVAAGRAGRSAIAPTSSRWRRGEGVDRLKAACGPNLPAVGTGTEGLIAVATHPSADIVICASAGTAGLEAVLAAIEAGKTIALANKEVLVMAGELVTAAARRRGVAILPVDSEHNAIHQCLHARPASEVRRIILTASGGPFRDCQADALEHVSPEAALQHPTWQMGRKITIDSATLMNKGLEVIEAHWLFGVSADQIDVVIHPQSIVHSLVELIDGSVIAQLGVTDMRLPIQYACSYPERWDGSLPSLDLARAGRLEFLDPAARSLSLPWAGVRGAAGRRDAPGRAERRERNCGWRIPRSQARLYGHPARHTESHACARFRAGINPAGGPACGCLGTRIRPRRRARVRIDRLKGHPST